LELAIAERVVSKMIWRGWKNALSTYDLGSRSWEMRYRVTSTTWWVDGDGRGWFEVT